MRPNRSTVHGGAHRTCKTASENRKWNACSPRWFDYAGDGDVRPQPATNVLSDAALPVWHGDVKTSLGDGQRRENKTVVRRYLTSVRTRLGLVKRRRNTAEATNGGAQRTRHARNSTRRQLTKNHTVTRGVYARDAAIARDHYRRGTVAGRRNSKEVLCTSHRSLHEPWRRW